MTFLNVCPSKGPQFDRICHEGQLPSRQTTMRPIDCVDASLLLSSTQGTVSNRFGRGSARLIQAPRRKSRSLVCSDLGAFGQCERIFDVYAEIANGALDLRVSEKDLHRT